MLMEEEVDRHTKMAVDMSRCITEVPTTVRDPPRAADKPSRPTASIVAKRAIGRECARKRWLGRIG